MLRRIQGAATLTALLFAVGAIFDLIMVHLGKLDASAIAGDAFPLADLPFTPVIAGAITFWVAAILLGATVVAQISVRASRRAAPERLDGWRRVTWAVSIIETAGALLFIFNGMLLFLPAAVALLLVGVAELATIWRDMERRPENAALPVLSREHRLHL
jgi:hypothetical protein